MVEERIGRFQITDYESFNAISASARFGVVLDQIFTRTPNK